MHEEDLRFVKEMRAICGDDSKSNMTISVSSSTSREQWDETIKRHQEAIDRRTLDQGMTKAENINHETLRIPFDCSVPHQTLEEKDAKANDSLPYVLESGKDNADGIVARSNKTLTYLTESISKESREATESGSVGHFCGSGFHVKVRISEYRYQFIAIRNWDTYEAETKEKIAIVTAYRDFWKAVSEMFDRKLKERVDDEAVTAILKEAKELIIEHKRLSPKVKKIMDIPKETLTFKDEKIFIEGRERLRIIEDKVHTLSLKFDTYDTAPETEFPAIEGFTSDLCTSTNQTAREIERLYRREIEKQEASKKR